MQQVKGSNDYRRALRVNIRIEDVAIYSFSENEDGTLSFWAAGRAGWYELHKPLPSYGRIFRGMQEATGLFYFLADKFRNARPRPRRDKVGDTEKLARYMMAKVGAAQGETDTVSTKN